MKDETASSTSPSPSASVSSSLTRRQFNRGGLATLVAAGVAPAIQLAGAQGASKMKLGFAVMGLGGFWEKTISEEMGLRDIRIAEAVYASAANNSVSIAL